MYVPRTYGYTIFIYLLEGELVKETKLSSFFLVSIGTILERKRATNENRLGESLYRKMGIDPQWKIGFSLAAG